MTVNVFLFSSFINSRSSIPPSRIALRYTHFFIRTSSMCELIDIVRFLYEHEAYKYTLHSTTYNVNLLTEHIFFHCEKWFSLLFHQTLWCDCIVYVRYYIIIYNIYDGVIFCCCFRFCYCCHYQHFQCFVAENKLLLKF